MVLGQELTPAAVAQLGQLHRRADDVGEQNGGQHAIGLDLVPLATLPQAAEEALCMAADLLRADPPAVIVTRKPDEARAKHVLCDVPPSLDRDDPVSHGMQGVGALIDERTWRTSMSLFMAKSAAAAPGLELVSTHLRHQGFALSSPAMLGEYRVSHSSSHASVPNRSDAPSMTRRHTSGVGAHG